MVGGLVDRSCALFRRVMDRLVVRRFFGVSLWIIHALLLRPGGSVGLEACLSIAFPDESGMRIHQEKRFPSGGCVSGGHEDATVVSTIKISEPFIVADIDPLSIDKSAVMKSYQKFSFGHWFIHWGNRGDSVTRDKKEKGKVSREDGISVVAKWIMLFRGLEGLFCFRRVCLFCLRFFDHVPQVGIDSLYADFFVSLWN